METEIIHLHLLSHLVEHYGIKLKYIKYITFGNEFNVLLNEYQNTVEIGIFSHEHAFKSLKHFGLFRGYKVNRVYLGEYSETKPGKSWLCKRTEKELEEYYRSSNPCHGCELEKCNVQECPGIKKLQGNE